VVLLFLEPTIMIMFFLAAIKRLLKILSWKEETIGRHVPSGVARHNFEHKKFDKHMCTNIWFIKIYNWVQFLFRIL
jgi:hypothetical protein